MNRRQFLITTVAAVTTGCASVVDNKNGSGVLRVGRVINAGPVANYAADGVYDAFGDLGFFVISKEGKLTVLSAICTHGNCKLKAGPDHSFYCKCHVQQLIPTAT